MSTILISKWVGELGWEILHWQSYLRKVTAGHKFDRVICYIQPGNELMYRDFATEFRYLERANNTEGWKSNHGHYIPTFIPSELSEFKNDQLTVCCPDKRNMNMPISEKSFIKFGHKNAKVSYDVLMHARWSNKCGSHNRDWPMDKWSELMQHMNGLRVASIGIKGFAKKIPDTKDLRDISLDELADTMASSAMVIGPSSGPMHFASLCGCTHIVWTDDKVWGGVGGPIRTNKYRYEVAWNPLKTKCIVLDTCNWNPKPHNVAAIVKEVWTEWSKKVNANPNYFS